MCNHWPEYIYPNRSERDINVSNIAKEEQYNNIVAIASR